MNLAEKGNQDRAQPPMPPAEPNPPSPGVNDGVDGSQDGDGAKEVPIENRVAEMNRRFGQLQEALNSMPEKILSEVGKFGDSINERLGQLELQRQQQENARRVSGQEPGYRPPKNSSQHQQQTEPLDEDRMRNMITETVSKMWDTRDRFQQEVQAHNQAALRDYPDLAVDGSELRKATEQIVQELQEGGYNKPDIVRKAAALAASNRKAPDQGASYNGQPPERPSVSGSPSQQEPARLRQDAARAFNLSPEERELAKRYAQLRKDGRRTISNEEVG
ncbi:MAG: hypothetical protein GF355_09615 [Candidatus Eisenbacteria bacterium]|nr:hypothetical protein [Candidatus Eisenbacteria bacterium]